MLIQDVLKSRNLMDHEVVVRDVADRRSWLVETCAGASVLHVGCCDVPVFDPETNLHVFLAKHTDRLDGLDVSESGIDVLRKHVDGDYFTHPSQVGKEYDVVLVPEVLEHTRNAHEFLTGIFGIMARTYLITAPHIQWFERTRREGAVFHEHVHGDHKTWYSPYTLLSTLLPFIDEDRDDIEVLLLKSTGSVAARITKPRTPKPFQPRRKQEPLEIAPALELAAVRVSEGDVQGALRVIEAARTRNDDARLIQAEVRILLSLGRNLDALKLGVTWMKMDPNDPSCLELCADAFESLGDAEQAGALRARATELRSE